MDDHDKKNFEFIKEYINKNDILVDVGANEGDYTNFFKDILNDTGKIYSIELVPSIYNSLFNRFKNNDNITILNNAVSDIDDVIVYYKGETEFTNNIIGHDMNFKSNPSAGEIESIRLDTLLSEHDEIKLIKIDVEGAEFLVLNGMKNIINKIKYVLVECHLDKDWDNIRNLLLNEYGFSCVNVTTGEIITMDSKRPYQCFCKKI
jgi:FkbM family methyltransferase